MQLLKYTVLRLGIFLVVFLGLFLGLKWPVFIAGLIGLIVAFAVSYLFFNKLRISAGQDVSKAFSKTSSNKTKKQLDDEAVEDAYDDAQRKPTDPTA
ncbi:DUF4229 domain-containing protein [Glutamicibacter sp.]|uniref:DUF4229 domain-containing protein n=1 Tax=Glutamicibacter sp. TaxID=1931995 RepID=UPI0028BF37D1|nr:DUF4229 domain-containing protein [Glutamicibacter sp.]